MMKRTALLATVLLSLFLAVGVVAPPAEAAAAVPVPEDDPFYAVPPNIAQYDDGEVIAARRIAPKAFEIPLPALGWQVLYRTEDRVGRPTATVTTIFVPTAPWKGAGPRPLLSYQTAEDGVAGKCAPSYAFSAGIRGGITNSYPEQGLVAMALAHGWTVAVPDYEGPRSQFLVAGVQAKGVLDGIRAARSFAPAGVDPAARIGLWGYSGGSLASLTAAQYQPTYAPELRLSALAVGGLVADIRATIDAFDGSIFGGAIPMGINGFVRGYPGLHVLSYLSASGQQMVEKSAADCITDAVPRHPFLKVSQIEAVPQALSRPPIASMLRANSPLFMPGVPEVPIYHYHATLDELAPIGPARAVLRRFCAAGVDVESHETLLGEHLTEAGRGAPGALQFLARRFSGEAPRNTCAAIPR